MLGRVFAQVLSGLNMLASIYVLCLMFLICADVFGRSLLDAPLPGVPEIVKFTIVGMVWLQVAYVLRSRAHLRSTIILDALPRGGKRVVLVLNALTGAAVVGLIAWYAWPEFIDAWQTNAFEGVPPVEVPITPIWATVVLGAGLMLVQFLVDIVRYLRGEDDDGPEGPSVG